MNSTTIDGGCQCGSIRYRISGRPKMLYVCHCRDCQKQSSSAFGMSLIVAPGDWELVQGQARIESWDTRADDGSLKRCWFCPQCGTRLYHGSDRDDEAVSIKAGSLDDTGWLQPVAHIWLDSAQPWVPIDRERLRCFAAEPDEEADLERRWRRQQG